MVYVRFTYFSLVSHLQRGGEKGIMGKKNQGLSRLVGWSGAEVKERVGALGTGVFLGPPE